MKKKLMLIISILSLSILILTLVSCSSSKRKPRGETANGAKIISLTTDQVLDTSIRQFLLGNLPEGGDNYFSADIKVDEEDKADGYTVIDSYSNTNALYYKIYEPVSKQYSMYRFQFDNSGYITSYIKFILEA